MLKNSKPLELNDNLAGEYIYRINRVIDYIDQNLQKDLTVDELAAVANFSKFHFHRIFGAIVGEPLGKFVQRLRIEKAAVLLINNPKSSVTDIALETGFSGSAAFSRAFREYYNLSPSEWRNQSKICKTFSNNSYVFSNIRKEISITPLYFTGVQTKQYWRVKMPEIPEITTEVTVKDIPAFTVAYVRHIGPYKGDEKLFELLWGKLCKWAGPRGLLSMKDVKYLTIYHDNPDVTDEDNLRISVCISIPDNTQVEGEIGKLLISASMNAVARFEIYPDQYQAAWDSIYAGWLPQSGYQPDDGPCYELFLMDPKEHPEGKHLFEIHVPVKPL
jgi:AraC family transcriptional regulator